MKIYNIKHKITRIKGVSGGAVGWGIATSRKIVGSIPYAVIGIFHWRNFSGRTMVLGSTQALTEMSTKHMSRGLRRLVRTADNLTTFMCLLSRKSGGLDLPEPRSVKSSRYSD
jgi:hypothetical protein